MSVVTTVLLTLGAYEENDPGSALDLALRAGHEERDHGRGQALLPLTGSEDRDAMTAGWHTEDLHGSPYTYWRVLRGHTRAEGGVRPSDAWGGCKVPEATVWGAAFNYIGWDAFAAWVAALPLEHPECVRVLAKNEGDTAFEVWLLDAREEPRRLVRLLGGCPD